MADSLSPKTKNNSTVNRAGFGPGLFCLLGNSHAVQASNTSFFLLELCILCEPGIAVHLEGTAMLCGVAEESPFTHNTEDETTFLTEGARVTCLLGKLPIYWATRRLPLAPHALNHSVHIRLPPVSLSFTSPVPPSSFLCADSNDELLICLSSVESISLAMTGAWWRSGGYRYQVLPVTGCPEQASKPLFLLGTPLAECG